MVDNCAELVRNYLSSLEGSFSVQETADGCVIVTPFMRRDNDFIEIGVERMPDGRLLLSDYGETIAFLNLSGVNVARSSELKRILAQTARKFTVEIQEDDISAYATDEALGKTLKNVIDAVNDVAYLVYKRQRRPPTAFDDRVEKVLISHDFPYEPNFPVQGKTELHRFRFYVDGRFQALIEPLSATSPTSALAKAERLAFRWLDIGEARQEFRRLAVLDDDGPKSSLWSGKPLEVLSGYADGVVLWSGIEQLPSYVARERMV
jgi:hypothetical protein